MEDPAGGWRFSAALLVWSAWRRERATSSAARHERRWWTVQPRRSAGSVARGSVLDVAVWTGWLMVWAAPAERSSRVERDDAPENVETASLPGEAGARAAVFEEPVSAESVDRPSGARPALSAVETGAKDAAGAREPSPDDSAGLAVWLALQGQEMDRHGPKSPMRRRKEQFPGSRLRRGVRPGLRAWVRQQPRAVPWARQRDPACAGAGTVLPPPAGRDVAHPRRGTGIPALRGRSCHHPLASSDGSRGQQGLAMPRQQRSVALQS